MALGVEPGWHPDPSNLTLVSSNSSDLYVQVAGLVNTVYYLLLVPIALVGNVLTLIVAATIVRHQRSRRSIPDVCLGALAAVDVFSVLCVHSVTLAGLGGADLASSACRYQAAAAALYLKMEFLVQVIISLDRHFAVVRPLRYHRLSSLHAMRGVLLVSLTLAIVATVTRALLAPSDVMYIPTWCFCTVRVQLSSPAAAAINGIVGSVFLAGFTAFIVCNVSLVRLLRRYHARRASALLRDISAAMDAIKEGKPPTPRSPPRLEQTVKGGPPLPQGYGPPTRYPHPARTTGSHTPTVTPTPPVSAPHDVLPFTVTGGGDRGSILAGGTGESHVPQTLVSRSIADRLSTGNDKIEVNIMGEVMTPDKEMVGQENVELCETRLSKDGVGQGGDSAGLSGGEAGQGGDSAGMDVGEAVLDGGAAGLNAGQMGLGGCPVPHITVELYDSQGGRSSGNIAASHHHNSNQISNTGPNQDVDANSSPRSITSSRPVFNLNQSSSSSSSGSSVSHNMSNGLKYTPDNVRVQAQTISVPSYTSQQLCSSSDENGTHSETMSTPMITPLSNMLPSEKSHPSKPGIKKSVSFVLPRATSRRYSFKKSKSFDQYCNRMDIAATNFCAHAPMLQNGNGACVLTHFGGCIQDNVCPSQSYPPLCPPRSSSPRDPPLTASFPAGTLKRSRPPNIILPPRGVKKGEDTPRSPTQTSPQVTYLHQNLHKFLRKMQRKARHQRRELVLARVVLLCASLFVGTWIPYCVVVFLGFFDVHLDDLVHNLALKLVFLNALLNPLFYGLCRKNYRGGYRYLLRAAASRGSCGWVNPPSEDQIFFESRKKKVRRHLEGYEVRLPAARRKSAHALQILHQTLQLRPTSPAAERPPTPMAAFTPSRQLEALFARCVDESDSSDSTSSIDYDALVFDDDLLYQNLQRVWSMCLNTDDNRSYICGNFDEVTCDENLDEIDLDVDYDALVGMDTHSCQSGIIMSDVEGRGDGPRRDLGVPLRARLASSAPNLPHGSDTPSHSQ